MTNTASAHPFLVFFPASGQMQAGNTVATKIWPLECQEHRFSMGGSLESVMCKEPTADEAGLLDLRRVRVCVGPKLRLRIPVTSEKGFNLGLWVA